MRFYGEDKDLVNLKESQENIIDTLLINAFNAGFRACNDIVASQHEQAQAAIKQKIDPGNLPQSNIFIALLTEYTNSLDNNNNV